MMCNELDNFATANTESCPHSDIHSYGKRCLIKQRDNFNFETLSSGSKNNLCEFFFSFKIYNFTFFITPPPKLCSESALVSILSFGLFTLLLKEALQRASSFSVFLPESLHTFCWHTQNYYFCHGKPPFKEPVSFSLFSVFQLFIQNSSFCFPFLYIHNTFSVLCLFLCPKIGGCRFL
jgi:hypothetical protein